MGSRGLGDFPGQRYACTERPASHATHNPRMKTVLTLMALYAGALAWALGRHAVSPVLPWALAGVNAATFIAYWTDKQAARQGRHRIAERTLHLWSLAGGWPAAWWAQRLLRHKSVKASFRRGYWGTVGLHGLAFAGWGALQGWWP